MFNFNTSNGCEDLKSIWRCCYLFSFFNRRNRFILFVLVCCLFIGKYAIAQASYQRIPTAVSSHIHSYKQDDIIFLHTNKDVFFNNDKVYFQAYVVNALSGLPSTKYSTIKIDILSYSNQDSVLQTFHFPNTFENNNGYFPLNLSEGYYLLKAHLISGTGQIGSNQFNRIIKVQKSKIGPTLTISDSLNIFFKSESGTLIDGQPSRLAIKFLDNNGCPIVKKGAIKDGQDLLTKFSTTKFSDSFILIPKSDIDYQLSVSWKDFSSEFPIVNTQGVSIKYRDKGDHWQFVITPKFESNRMTEQYFVLHSKGMLIAQQEIGLNNSQVIKVEKEGLRQGLFVASIVDSYGSVKAERLVYHHNSEPDALEMKISMINQTPILQIYAAENWSATDNLISVSVVGNKKLKIRSNPDFEQHFHINARSTVQSSFYNQENIDLEMILADPKRGDELKGHSEIIIGQGFQLTGIADNYSNDSTVEARLLVLNDDAFFFSGSINRLGKIIFPNVSFYDSAFYKVQIKNKKKWKSMDVKLDMTPALPITKVSICPQPYSLTQTEDLLYEFDSIDYLLDDFTVEARRLEDLTIDRVRSNQGIPDHTIHFDDMKQKYVNILDALNGRVGGVQTMAKNGEIKTFFGTSEASYFLNGFQEFDSYSLSTLNQKDIDRIEVFKTQGRNVISVYTKIQDVSDSDVKWLVGYNSQNRDSRYDWKSKSMLYWGASLSIAKADTLNIPLDLSLNMEEIIVSIEGVSNNGKIISLTRSIPIK